MRASNVLSFLVAVALAGLAVFGARDLLLSERQAILATRPAAPVEAVEEKQQNTIVVADEALRFGERVTRDRLREIEWSSDILPTGSFKTVEDMIADDTDEKARFVLQSMEAGEPVLASRITSPGVRAKLSTALTPGMKAMSIRVNDVLGVAGFVLPGDRVDVMLTRRDRNVEGGSYVDVLLQGTKVLAIDQNADKNKENPSVVRTVTFEVNTQEAQKLVLAANVGTLSLALRNIASPDVEAIERVTLVDLGIPDAADDLMEGPSADVLAEQARLAALEDAMEGMSEGLTARFESFQKMMEERAAEPAPEPASRKIPQRIVVSVVRNGQRSEYSVGTKDEE